MSQRGAGAGGVAGGRARPRGQRAPRAHARLRRPVSPPPPPPSPCTIWTRLVLPPVLSGHVSSAPPSGSEARAWPSRSARGPGAAGAAAEGATARHRCEGLTGSRTLDRGRATLRAAAALRDERDAGALGRLLRVCGHLVGHPPAQEAAAAMDVHARLPAALAARSLRALRFAARALAHARSPALATAGELLARHAAVLAALAASDVPRVRAALRDEEPFVRSPTGSLPGAPALRELRSEGLMLARALLALRGVVASLPASDAGAEGTEAEDGNRGGGLNGGESGEGADAFCGTDDLEALVRAFPAIHACPPMALAARAAAEVLRLLSERTKPLLGAAAPPGGGAGGGSEDELRAVDELRAATCAAEEALVRAAGAASNLDARAPAFQASMAHALIAQVVVSPLRPTAPHSDLMSRVNLIPI